MHKLLAKNRIARSFLVGGLALAGFASLCGCQASSQKQEVPELLDSVDRQVESYVVTKHDIAVLDAYETAVLPDLIELAFESSGVIEKFYYTVGSNVKAGDILASLEGSSDLLKSLQEQYDAMLEQNAYFNRLTEIDIETAKLSGNDTSRDELTFKQTKEMQAFELAHLTSQIEKAKNGLLSAEIIAPCDGVVVSLLNLEESAAITAKTPAMAIASDTGAYVTCEYMSASAADRLTKCYLAVEDATYDLEYVPYETEELAAAIKAGTAISTFHVKGNAPDLIGKYGIIYCVHEELKDVLSVPINSLYKNSDDSYYVYIMDGESRVQTPVEVGVIGTMYAEILSGVEEGASIYVKE